MVSENITRVFYDDELASNEFLSHTLPPFLALTFSFSLILVSTRTHIFTYFLTLNLFLTTKHAMVINL